MVVVDGAVGCARWSAACRTLVGMSEHRGVTEADIRRAETPAGAFYTSAEVYGGQRRALFPRVWHFVVAEDEVRTPRAVYPFTLLEGCLDEPLLFTRDDDDRLHCVSNVCTHRGATVCQSAGIGRGTTLTCRYHGRRFNLDGTFKSMPEFEEAEGFPRAEDDLAPARWGRWRQFLFASLEPAMALEAVTADLERLCGFLPIERARLDATRQRDYLVHANWALYLDNYLEGFHIPYVHASLNEAIDYGAYTVETYAWSSLQLGVASGAEETFDLPAGHPFAGERVAAFYVWMFPLTMFNVYPWGISVNVVRPLGVDCTKVTFLPYVWDASKLERGAGAALDRVEREDEEVVEDVQRGLRSRLYTRGRYSPKREMGVHHFHRLVTTFVADGGGA